MSLLFIFQFSTCGVETEKVQDNVFVESLVIQSPVPSYLRIKRWCGIPDSVQWSYAVKCKYHKRILFVIDSLELEVKSKKDDRRTRRIRKEQQ